MKKRLYYRNFTEENKNNNIFLSWLIKQKPFINYLRTANNLGLKNNLYEFTCIELRVLSSSINNRFKEKQQIEILIINN